LEQLNTRFRNIDQSFTAEDADAYGVSNKKEIQKTRFSHFLQENSQTIQVSPKNKVETTKKGK
jgi:hypothetical protein